MADLIKDSIISGINYIASDIKSSINKQKRKRVYTNIELSSQIALYPLYGESNSYDKAYQNNELLVFPILPSDIMFNEDSNVETVKLINFGELPVGMNRKLTTWSFDSFFPYRTTNVPKYSSSGEKGYIDGGNFKYWFDISNGTDDPYKVFCDKILTWKKEQTPLVFFFYMNNWGNYYNCQIKQFNYGRKDAIGNVYYQITFQEYVEYTQYDSSSASTDYSSDYYYPTEGENILQICKKIYGDSDKYQYFMNLNSMSNPLDIVVGHAYKVR